MVQNIHHTVEKRWDVTIEMYNRRTECEVSILKFWILTNIWWDGMGVTFERDKKFVWKDSRVDWSAHCTCSGRCTHQGGLQLSTVYCVANVHCALCTLYSAHWLGICFVYWARSCMHTYATHYWPLVIIFDYFTVFGQIYTHTHSYTVCTVQTVHSSAGQCTLQTGNFCLQYEVWSGCTQLHTPPHYSLIYKQFLAQSCTAEQTNICESAFPNVTNWQQNCTAVNIDLISSWS